ncbi:MAG: S-layer homology domain-containing protein [Clostridiales bacterium]|jgi:hypothetical protein|nr:S-layer homology domain-containing protein [Clostridiales bacterium]
MKLRKMAIAMAFVLLIASFPASVMAEGEDFAIKAPENWKISVGDSADLEYSFPADAKNKALDWESSDEKIAKVDQGGKVTGVAAGQALIAATPADKAYTSDSALVVVVPKELEVPELSDVKSTDWFAKDVEWAFKNGITSGAADGVFAPNTPVSRAMTISMLHRLIGTPKPALTASFNDVLNSSYYFDAVSWAQENEISVGTGGSLFSPEVQITRQDFAVMLDRFARLIDLRWTVTQQYIIFGDEEEIAPYAMNALQLWYKLDIMTGYGNNKIGPRDILTRAQIVAILHRFNEWAQLVGQGEEQ